MSPQATISIDVDPIACYYTIHALGASPDALRDVIFTRSLPRYLELFSSHNIKATFFLVASDVEASHTINRDIATKVIEAGHTVGNHSWSHPYDLARMNTAEVKNEITTAHDILSELIGHQVRGFRAPGYDLSPTMLRQLEALDYLYDSSIFPAPGYYAAKALVMAGLKARRRPSGAVMTNPKALLAPAEPYRPNSNKPWRRGHSSVVELPVAVTPWMRTPAIGTNMLLAPKWIRDHWIRSMTQRPHFNFELHGIDLCDAKLDEFPAELVAKQPDLRRSLNHKLDVLSDVLLEMSQRFELTTLEQLAHSI